MLRKYGHNMPGNIHEIDMDAKLCPFYPNTEIGYQTVVRSILDQCREVKPDCLDVYYDLKKQTEFDADINQPGSIISLQKPTEPDIYTKNFLKLSLFDFFIGIGAIISTWMGFSILSMVDLGIKWMSILKTKQEEVIKCPRDSISDDREELPKKRFQEQSWIESRGRTRALNVPYGYYPFY